MSYIFIDPDEFETVVEHRPCTACKGDRSKCHGQCNGMSGYSQRRRPADEIAKIKAEKRRAHEDKILVEAALIRARREAKP